MNPAQLLNPKAFAKQQAKPKAAQKSQNNGLQQIRNPTVASRDENADEDASFGAASMIERLHGVTNRNKLPTQKRKGPLITDDEDENQRKKQKTEAFSISKGGIISDHLKNERKKIAAEAEPSNQTIDLTGDDDEPATASATANDLEVAKVVESSNDEICLGSINANALVHRLPTPSTSLIKGVPKTSWPYMRISFRHEIGHSYSRNMHIDLIDSVGIKFGTMDVKAASAIAPLLDGANINRMRLRMHLLSRPRKPSEEAGQRVSELLKMTVTFFAPRKAAAQIGRWLSQKQLYLSEPLSGAGGREFENPQLPQSFGPPRGSKPQQSSKGASTFISRSVEEIRREATNMFDNLAKNEAIPSMESNKDIIATDLMEHQKKALSFLFEHERSDFDGNELPVHALWRYRAKNTGQPAWYHVITGQEVTEKPKPVQGGILADVMGLGKTLSILALIAGTRTAAVRFRQQTVPFDLEDDVDCNAKGTLIICPKSVLSNWEEQIRVHCREGKIKVYCYHGANRTQNTAQLAKFDVVLTTYNTAAAEFADGMKKKKALSNINWFRIVLDEAHQIRTTSTKVSKACCNLYAERRWAVTGTPVQNSLSDLGALVKFLNIPPFDNTNTWNQYIMSPFKMGNVDVVEQLQLLVGSITLRRLKDTIGLTKRTETIERLEFSEAEKALYKKFASTCRTTLDNVTGGGTTLRGKAYAHVLKSIGRLRAICAHGREMLTEEDMKEIEGDDPNNAIVIDIGDEPGYEDESEFTTDAQAYNLYKTMRDSEMDKCENCGRLVGKKEPKPINLDEEEDNSAVNTPTISEDDEADDLIGNLTPCFHVVCPGCTSEYMELCEESMTADRWHVCPYDETHQHFGLKPLTWSGYNSHIEERRIAANQPNAAKWDEDSYSGPHTKVKALLEELRQSEQESAELATLGEPPIRSVVFSGWTRYLDLIEHALIKSRVAFVRLDGSMSIKQRTQVMEMFKTEKDIVVMLVSIKAGGQGLNFTAANKVYVMEPQFNPGVEAQAVDRVHRLGQKRDVYIKRYIMQDSIEEGILGLQEKKNKLAQMSMEKKRSKAEENKQRLDDLKALFK
ncbi:hypothetical protein AC578_10641 [Pseudocercospora eumusae]|uniref:Helicase ATP-binding domain-containing protein n=1 Tax=Pseudocercospora eumusae TaxID=321146 RepID=A0A139GWN8_9PEZI|nr:hypothetical protein AC578_10641 [Pseudocercospora eumusae]